MNLWESTGILGILLIVILVIIGICFGIVTATIIATALGATGLNWWIVSITMFGALGGCGGSLVRINRD